MIWLVFGVIWLVLGIVVLRRVVLRPSGIGLLLAWIIGLVIIITYAEQHDDVWEQYVGNISLAAGYIYASVKIMTNKLGSLEKDIKNFKANLDQRLDDHANNDAKVFDQFEKRMMEKSDQLEKRIMGKLDGMAKPRKT